MSSDVKRRSPRLFEMDKKRNSVISSSSFITGEENSTINTVIKQTVDALQILSQNDINSFFREVDSRLTKRFSRVQAALQFHDLPQGLI